MSVPSISTSRQITSIDSIALEVAPKKESLSATLQRLDRVARAAGLIRDGRVTANVLAKALVDSKTSPSNTTVSNRVKLGLLLRFALEEAQVKLKSVKHGKGLVTAADIKRLSATDRADVARIYNLAGYVEMRQAQEAAARLISERNFAGAKKVLDFSINRYGPVYFAFVSFNQNYKAEGGALYDLGKLLEPDAIEKNGVPTIGV
jgi:hypothetical protein